MSSDRGSGSSYAILKVAVMSGMLLFSDLICNYSVRKEADSHTNIRIMASELETDDITDQSLIRPLGTELLPKNAFLVLQLCCIISRKEAVIFTFCKQRTGMKYPVQRHNIINEFFDLLQRPGVAEVNHISR